MIHSRKALLALSLCTGLIPGAALAADNNGAGGAATLNATVGSLAVNGGRFICTAAINSDGTIATTLAGSFIDATRTFKVGTGDYQVAFKGPCGNVQIQNGWFRVVQRDTLTTGVLPDGTCIVADRAGVPSAVFIRCFNTAGVQANTSFTVSVSR
jgi:hypothetical protein